MRFRESWRKFPSTMTAKQCDQCGESFSPRQYENRRRQRFCSARCQKRAKDRRYYARTSGSRNIASAKAWASRNPEKMREYQRRSHLKRKFGMVVEDYDALFARQDGCCAICGTSDTAPWDHFSVDHNHESGEVRGLLCRACNTCIGQAEDNPERLRKAIAYLESR